VSLQEPAVTSDRQLCRLLQIGVVLEELVETDADHAETTDDAVRAVLDDSASEATRHRETLRSLLGELEASVDQSELAPLVEAQYTPDEESDGVLYDQLANEETAYKFYDDLIGAIEATDAAFSIDRDRLVTELKRLRADEKRGVERVTELMER